MKKIITVLAAVLMMAILSVFTFTASAAGSPNSPIKDPTIKPGVTVNTDGSITFVAENKDGYNFDHWVITGDYTIVTGSTTTQTVVIKFQNGTSITGKPIYVKTDDNKYYEAEDITANKKTDGSTVTYGTTTGTKTTVEVATGKVIGTTNGGDSSSSPKTADTAATAVAIVLGLGAVALTTKKLCK